jgi:hypothetical protein
MEIGNCAPTGGGMLCPQSSGLRVAVGHKSHCWLRETEGKDCAWDESHFSM